MPSDTFHHTFPISNQVRFSLVDVFHESLEYTRNYTLPFNMIGICIRSEGEQASVVTNLETGKMYESHENDITLTPYNLSQQYHHTRRNERYGIHFRLELYPGIDVFSGCKERIVENSPELRKEADEIFADTNQTRMLTRCSDFALRICLRHWPEHYNFDAERIKPFEPLFHEIRNTVNAKMRVEDMADKINFSKSYFTHQFADIFHKTPKQYLQDLLFQRALSLLRSPDESVKSVAEKLQFSDEFYFSRFFKRLSGVCPKEYKSKFSVKCAD